MCPRTAHGTSKLSEMACHTGMDTSSRLTRLSSARSGMTGSPGTTRVGAGFARDGCKEGGCVCSCSSWGPDCCLHGPRSGARKAEAIAAQKYTQIFIFPEYGSAIRLFHTDAAHWVVTKVRPACERLAKCVPRCPKHVLVTKMAGGALPSSQSVTRFICGNGRRRGACPHAALVCSRVLRSLQCAGNSSSMECRLTEGGG